MEHWVAHYGGLALFVLLIFGIIGLPVPDETLLVFCGYLIYKGALNPVTTWLGGALGSICGISGSYAIGRTVGLGFLHSRFSKWLHITDERIQKVHDWFDHIGHWALLLGYYIPGVRHLFAIVAGTSCLEYRTFALFAYAGACIWVTTFLFLGYRFGEDWERMFNIVHHNLVIVSIFAGSLLLIYILAHRYIVKRRARK